jgi:hypothetical protein
MEELLVALFLIMLAGAVHMLVAAARVRPEEPAARFFSGWLGAYGLMLGLASGTGLASVLAAVGVETLAGVAAAVVLKLVLQPLALLICWAGIRKVTLGVCGQVAYAWRRIPDAELADVPQAVRRRLAWFCVLQGVTVLPLGAGISAVVASPLILWFMR